MHIPDGYLGPQTYVPLYGVMAGFWASATSKAKRTLRVRQAPMLALSAAFSFVVMMFNVPIPGGTTGHAVGAVLIAILLGPWAAVIAVSLALIVQALIYGDGGITAIGANCFNMAVVMPFVGWWVYRLIAGSSPVTSARRCLAGAIGGYAGLNAAALCTAVMFGIQPLLAHNAAGQALYCPFGLKVAIPAMMLEHLTLFGIVEAAATGLVLQYLQRTAPELIPAPSAAGAAPATAAVRRLGIGLTVLALLTPLGLYLPAKFGAGSAWGEWGADEIGKLAGYVPSGLRAAEGRWRAAMPDYALPGQENAPLLSLAAAYVLAAAVGIAAVIGLTLLLRRYLTGKDERVGASRVDDGTMVR